MVIGENLEIIKKNVKNIFCTDTWSYLKMLILIILEVFYFNTHFFKKEKWYLIAQAVNINKN